MSLRPVTVSHQTETTPSSPRASTAPNAWSPPASAASRTARKSPSQRPRAGNRCSSRRPRSRERPPTPKEEARASFRAACAADIQKLCPDAERGKGMRACLRVQRGRTFRRLQGCAPQAGPRKAGRARRRAAPLNERLRPLYQAPDRDDAAGVRRDARRLARLLVAAGLVTAAGRLPDHSGHDPIAGREPRNHGQSGDSAAGAPARADFGADVHDVVIVLRHQPDHAAVRARSRHRRRRAGRAGRHQCRRLDAAAQPALSADLCQTEPGRHADHHACPDVRHHTAAHALRPRRHADGAAPGVRDRGWARGGPGRHQAGGAHPGGPFPSLQLRSQHGGPAHRHRRRQRVRTQGLARRPLPVLRHLGQRPDHHRRSLQGR